ncbi:MAG: GH1 family beta-glucosidase [Frankia sp.]
MTAIDPGAALPTPHARPASAGAPLVFPAGFQWGAGTACYQIEGAVAEDGRRPSIWDTFSHTPGKVRGDDTGDIACDHYRRYASDVALMAEIGLDAYRFSVCWPRIQPIGRGPVNQPGLDFYQRLTDSLLAAGITPVVTLYHWDLPQALEDAGGWPARDTALRFAEFASVVHEALGDRVDLWTTLNEPWCSAYVGYGVGRHAPGRRDWGAAVRAHHHLLLGHGLAVEALRANARPAQTVSLALNLAPVHPRSPHPRDLAAAELVDMMFNRSFLDPVLRGRYPDPVLATFDRFTPVAELIHDGDPAIIGAPIDSLGVNYYWSHEVAGATPTEPGTENEWVGTEQVVRVHQPPPYTASGWPVNPDGLREMLVRLARDYPGLPMTVTENGAAYPDRTDPDGAVPDLDRIGYLDQHLRAAHAAISAGADLRGYFVWSLMDNFEWAEGYAHRFGLIHVDYPTGKRTPKASAGWYGEVARRGDLPAAGTRDAGDDGER